MTSSSEESGEAAARPCAELRLPLRPRLSLPSADQQQNAQAQYLGERSAVRPRREDAPEVIGRLQPRPELHEAHGVHLHLSEVGVAEVARSRGVRAPFNARIATFSIREGSSGHAVRRLLTQGAASF